MSSKRAEDSLYNVTNGGGDCMGYPSDNVVRIFSMCGNIDPYIKIFNQHGIPHVVRRAPRVDHMSQYDDHIEILVGSLNRIAEIAQYLPLPTYADPDDPVLGIGKDGKWY